MHAHENRLLGTSCLKKMRKKTFCNLSPTQECVRNIFVIFSLRLLFIGKDICPVVGITAARTGLQ